MSDEDYPEHLRDKGLRRPDELTDRVAFCVVKANCNGPSICEQVGERDVWTCRHCFGFVTLDRGQQPEKVHRLPYGTRGLA